MINLETVAENMFADIINDGITDIDDIRDAIGERSCDAADSACTYYSQCDEIIRRYESDPRADTDSADDMGATYKPSEYLSAMRDYAFYIARAIIECEASALADEMDETYVNFFVAMNSLNNRALDSVTQNDIRLSADCPHGWASHDYENESGMCFWVSRQLDGCNAVAVPAAGIWLSYTWE